MKRTAKVLLIVSLVLMSVTIAGADQDALVWSTFLGGNGEDIAYDITVAQTGDLYITGFTRSSEFPTTPGAYDTIFTGNCAIYVAKINSAGDAFGYATFLCGGPHLSYGYGIAVDDQGCAYVTGSVSNENLVATSGAFDPSYNGRGDLFVAKLNAAGSDLEYCTYLGGSEPDEPGDIAIDHLGCAYITGETLSNDFPTTPGSFDIIPDMTGVYYDAFVTKINPSGEVLEYSTFLGGVDLDRGNGIAVDESGCVYVTGWTNSTDFPVTPGALDTTFDGSFSRMSDVFISKLNPMGSDLLFSTFLGSTGNDIGFDIVPVEDGPIWVVGWTESDNFPTTPGTFGQTLRGEFDAFVAALDDMGAHLICSTLLGGARNDLAVAVVLDDIGTITIIGETLSSDFPVTSTALDTSNNLTQDVFIAQFDPSCTMLQYASYLGGGSTEYACGISLDGAGNTYLTGQTRSPDFPTTPGALDTICVEDDYDAFISKCNLISTAVLPEPIGESLPKDSFLHPNYPNPFNAVTQIRYQLTKEADVSLKIYNIAGQMVRTLVNARQPAGFHTAAWDGTHDDRQSVASGIYFCRLQTGRAAETIKMVLVR